MIGDFTDKQKGPRTEEEMQEKFRKKIGICCNIQIIVVSSKGESLNIG